MRSIDADALIAHINECIDVQNDNWEFERAIGLTVALECISDAPTIEPEQRWIPCSERLPSEGEYVLVTEKWHGYVRMWRLQYIDNEPTWEVNGYNIDIDEAVAWMPLPEPYREEDDDETN